MTPILFTAMPTADAHALWNDGPDAYGQSPDRFVSDGGGNTCRHCLQLIGEGESALLLAYRPFPSLQPYAETGPIFLHAAPCPRYDAQAIVPPILESPDYIVRGYSSAHRIVYGTGAVTPTPQIAARAADLLRRDEVAYVHVRSARNNCFQCRIDASPDTRGEMTGAQT